MQYRALNVFVGDKKRRVGLLFQYGVGPNAITRLVPDEGYWMDDKAPLFASFARVRDRGLRAAYIEEFATQHFFNGDGEALPPFFQNLLPEGPLRRHLEEIAGLDKGDHFGLLSVCGTDLPGAVYVEPAPQDRTAVAKAVTQQNDALEMSVVPLPVPEATSLCGVQPKLSLVEERGRYVARTKDTKGTHIIAKLPTVEYPLLPEVEELSMRMAQAAGVNVCKVQLQPLSAICAQQPYQLGNDRQFLAVERFDRTRSKHLHCEDFAQILNVPPEMKYNHPRATYAGMLSILANTEGLGQDAAHELLRRIVVNDLLGNFDGHLKNYCLLYRDGRTPELSPAYDIVAYSAYLQGSGHDLRFTSNAEKRQRITPMVIRQLANAVPALTETRMQAVVRDTVAQAFKRWPDMVEQASILPQQKQRLLKHFNEIPGIASLNSREAKRRAKLNAAQP